ncbi:MAG: hypothetical protein QM729_02210 [Solirubrobacterales bacterium]
MNELTVIKGFRAERDTEPPEAREAIWRALEARMDAAAAEARAFGEAVAGASTPGALGASRVGAPQAAAPRSRRRGISRRRRLTLAFAGAAAGAAVVTGALVLDSGPTAQPASAAEILHQAADAATSLPATSVPGPGQFLYRKEQRLEVQGWRSPLPPASANVPDGMIGGVIYGPHAFNGLVPVTTESWTDDKGGGRRREVLGTLQFWSKEEEARWRAAGSPLPAPFDPEYQRRYKATAYPDALELNSHVVDTESKGWGNFTFPDTSKLPTEAKALREGAEANELEYTGFNHVGGKAPRQLDAQETKEELLNVLQEGFPTPQLQAAIFDALAELPGITVEPEATDGLGRHGDAILTKVGNGVRSEYLFSPETGELLAQRAVLVEPGAADSFLAELPAGTVISERDFIAEAGVDSTTETGEAAEAG